MRRIDDYSLEVLLTLGLAFGGYQLAVWLHVSAPIMAVCAGLLIGDVGATHGMSEETRKYVDAFWKLIDEHKIAARISGSHSHNVYYAGTLPTWTVPSAGWQGGWTLALISVYPARVELALQPRGLGPANP